jgi:hypothetical protein
VIELGRQAGMPEFQTQDRSRVETLTTSLSMVLRTWFRMSCSCRRRPVESATGPCCGGSEHCVHQA